MWSSKVCSVKHSNLFHYEDQSSQKTQNHKKKHQEKMKNNNFVIREVPIHKLSNVEHNTGTNSSCDESNFGRGRCYSTNMNAIDYDVPELVVFIQEDHQQQYVKDICIDREIVAERRCDMNRTNDLNYGIMEKMSNNSFESDCSSQQISFKEAMKMHGFRNLMKSEMEKDYGNMVSVDQHLRKKTTSETLREAFKRERSISRTFENRQRNSSLGRNGSRVEFPHCKEENVYRHDISNLQSLTTSLDETQIDYSQETSNCDLDNAESGPTSCIAHAKTSSITSHQSNDSISSAQSFAFPTLPVEWSGSPVRMMEADKSQSKKHQWRKMWFPCCNCDD